MLTRETTGVPRALVVFLILHLAVALAFAVRGLQQTARDAKRTTSAPFAVAPPLQTYANITASSQGFGFFAPSVASEVRVIFSGCNRAKADWRDIDLGIRGEGEQALSSFLGVGLSTDDEKESQIIHDTLSRSLAAAALNQNPDIDTLIVKFQAELIGPLHSDQRRERKWVNLRVFTYYRPNL